MRLASTLKMPAITKVPISALPLPHRSHILTQNLTPDLATPSASSFRDVLTTNPSVQRRSRLVDSSVHFTHVAPLNLPFPYQIKPPEEDIEDEKNYVETWLSEREALEEQTCAPAPEEAERTLKKYSRSIRDIPRELIGLSDTGLQDCLPRLAVGNAFVQLGTPSLVAQEDVPARKVSGADNAITQELIDVLTGHSALMAIDEDSKVPYAPWSLRYSGHQFGNWAGQLGDGRAISILKTPHPSDPDLSYEIQLKGAGRTPYSRSADGLAVLRSSIREYLCAEAMNALRIPTTRSLALVHLPELQVIREQVETASVLTRVAPSFIRIGSFEALNPPQNVFFLGGGQQSANYDALRRLGMWVTRRVLRMDIIDGAPWAKPLIMECARRNAKMVAGWQVYGFMHGVINTDNVSIMGLTIDYGPYAFMDVFNSMHICNHSDEEGRYAYKFQPTMIWYALNALCNALAPVVGAEKEYEAGVRPGWANDVPKEKIEEWTNKGKKIVSTVKAEYEAVMEKEYWSLFRKRLGLKDSEDSDADDIVRPLLSLLESQKLDFHGTFRRLCSFRPSMLASDSPDALQAFIASIFKNGFQLREDDADATKAWCDWLSKYAERVERDVASGAWEHQAGVEGKQNGTTTDVWMKREREMKNANPRFVLRQWVLEEIIKRVQDDTATGKRALAKVHEMATNPYQAWGAEDDSRPESELSEEEREERRFCSLGSQQLLGFQCSCSS